MTASAEVVAKPAASHERGCAAACRKGAALILLAISAVIFSTDVWRQPLSFLSHHSCGGRHSDRPGKRIGERRDECVAEESSSEQGRSVSKTGNDLSRFQFLTKKSINVSNV